ncbi:NHL repeat-containing protein [candidate division KSB1 bacterium]|nr:NHL repeat-containing protein [candidate division KSB1 bacterium]
MNNKSNSVKNILSGFIIIVIAAGLTFLGYRSLSRKQVTESENPYEYNIEAFLDIPANLIHYSEIKKINTGLKNNYGIAVDSLKQLYVTGDSSVIIFDAEGAVHSSFSLPASANCIAVDKKFTIYLGILNHVEVYDFTGKRTAGWEPLEENSYITSIAASPENVYVADAGKQIVLRYDKSGTLLNRIGDKDEARDIPGFIVPSPYFDVAIDPDGFIWVVNPGRQSLENYNPNGDLRSFWGTASMRLEGFSGCCNPSHIALLPDGSFVTSEKGLERVKVHNRIGEFVSVVAPPKLFTRGTVGLDLAADADGLIYVLDPKAGCVRIFQKTNDRQV